MNLRRVRLTLTLWYSSVLVAVVLLITVPAYFFLTDKLSEESDETLYSSARGIAAQVDDSLPGQLVPIPASNDDDPFDYLSGRGDFFYAVVSPEGRPLLNPLGVDLGVFASSATIDQATDKGLAWRTVSTAAGSYRVLLLSVDGPGDTELLVAVGRSDAEHQRELDLVLLFIAGSGVIGVVLALGGGWYLGGRALEPAKLAFERQKDFVADASHELRTPLTVIRTNAEAIERYGGKSLAAQDREALRDIISESARMTDLVEDLLTLARLDAQEVKVEPSEFDLVELADLSLRYVRPLAAEKSLTLNLAAPSRIRVRSNEIAVSRVLRILLENAVQFSPENGRVDIRCSEDGKRAVVQVSDTGPGIATHLLDQVFDRFYRGDPARSGRAGTGLGLSIARSLIESLGGEIKATGTAGRGATLSFSLPLLPTSP